MQIFICEICRSNFDDIEIKLPCCHKSICQKHLHSIKSIYECEFCGKPTKIAEIFNTISNRETVKKFHLQKLKEKILKALLANQLIENYWYNTCFINLAEYEARIKARHAELISELGAKIQEYRHKFLNRVHFAIQDKHEAHDPIAENKLKFDNCLNKITHDLHSLKNLTELIRKYEAYKKNSVYAADKFFSSSNEFSFQSKLKNEHKIFNFDLDYLINKDLFNFSAIEIGKNGLVFLGNEKGQIEVWNSIKKTAPLRILTQPQNARINVLLYDDLNNHLISGSNEVKIWNLFTWKCVHTFSDCKKETVKFIKLFNNDDLLVSYADSSLVKIFNRKMVKLKKEMKFDFDIKCMEIGKNSDLIIGTSNDLIKIIDPETARVKRTLIGHFKSVECLKILPNNRLVSGSEDCNLKVWDLNSGLSVMTIYGHKDTVKCVQLVDKETLVTKANDDTIKYWDLTSGKCVRTMHRYNSDVFDLKAWNGALFCLGLKQMKRWCFKEILF